MWPSTLLRGGGDAAVHSQVGEEGLDLGRSHLAGMAFVVKEDEAAHPVYVGVLGVDGIVFLPQGGAGLVEQFGLFGLGRHLFALQAESEYTRDSLIAEGGRCVSNLCSILLHVELKVKCYSGHLSINAASGGSEIASWEIRPLNRGKSGQLAI